MVKARTWFTLFVLSLGTIAATASCGSDEATGGSGGGTIITTGGRAGSVGRGGSGGSGGSTPTGSLLGIPCSADSQCGDGLICIKANSTAFGDGGPSQGMCTKACEPRGTECDALKPGAGCFDFGTDEAPANYCLDACTQVEPGDLTEKCQGRADFVCADLAPEGSLPAPFCVPHCRSDAECGAGLYCDQSSLLGLCTKTKHKGDPAGTACDPEATTNTCEAICLRTSAAGVTPATGVCAELCSIGSECLYGAGSNPSPGGFCGGALSDQPSVIDLGYCLANCSCTSDCKMDGDLCRKWPTEDADLATLLGAPGICYPSVAMSTELSCGEGGAGGAGGAGAAGAAGAGGASGAAGDGPVEVPVGGAAGASGSTN